MAYPPLATSDEYVHMDQGGELGCCPNVIQLFESASYSIELTALDSSHQNGPGEHPCCTSGDAVHTMLTGTGLENLVLGHTLLPLSSFL